MNVAKVIPLYVHHEKEEVSLCCKVVLSEPNRRNRTYVRFYPEDITYDGIEEDIHNVFDVNEVHMQLVWFLPDYHADLPFEK